MNDTDPEVQNAVTRIKVSAVVNVLVILSLLAWVAVADGVLHALFLAIVMVGLTMIAAWASALISKAIIRRRNRR